MAIALLGTYVGPSGRVLICILTNPPFGKDLRLSVTDAKASQLTIAQKPKKGRGNYTFDHTLYQSRELGLLFVERCYSLLVRGGRLERVMD
jgi:hypothetical protein